MGVEYREYEHEIPQGADFEPLDRFVKRDGTAILAADVSGIDIRVFKTGDRTPVYEDTGIDAGNGSAGPIFDTLQTDGRWRKGPPGYNSRHLIEFDDVVAQAGHVYRFEIVVHHETEGRLISVHRYTIKAVKSISQP